MANYEGGLKGAAGGALAGSSFGPVGTIAGGLIGGLGGLFGGGPSPEEKQNRQMMLDYYNKVNGRQAPQMGPAAQGSLSSFRNNQADLINRLEAQSKGLGPSLAAQQLRAATDRNSAQQSSFANSGRGGPLAAMNAANNTAMLGAQAAQDAASARIAEQQMATNQLGLTLHGARGMDENMSQFNAGQTNEARGRNLEAKLRTMGMNDQAIAAVMAQMNGASSAQASRPDMGDQILAGGAGMYSQFASNKGAPMMSPIARGYPGAGGYFTPSGRT